MVVEEAVEAEATGTEGEPGGRNRNRQERKKERKDRAEKCEHPRLCLRALPHPAVLCFHVCVPLSCCSPAPVRVFVCG
jgi:hypothetical protein